MAKTKVKFNHDVEGGKMSVQAKAKGDGPNTGMPKTPAPDAISTPRSGAGQGYGANGPVGNSPSVEPGKRVLSPLAANLESSVDDDGVLAQVIAKGTARVDSEITSQLRKIADGNVPNHPYMKPANSGGAPGGTIPSKIGASSAQPVRKPGA
jgi:hypothetical protein